ncbi:MAG: glutamine synthetase III [Bacteroidia bacterium]|nr:glutamine synthetase III [Bacteroidia bacterium]
MAILRFKALEELHTRTPLVVENPGKVSTFYSENVFHRDTMKQYLQEDVFEKVMEAVELGTQLDRKVADAVATGMKAWALSKGVSHYTHWFQPLTGTTAEKHDGFFQPIDNCRAIEAFEGKQLIQQEPDASSFPNGGIRNTFEARGYSAWDPSSPAFIISSTLCIPTIFISYTGESLDYKAPLLKTLSALDKAATDVCQYFDKNVTKVVATLGWEQEYFLVDEALYNARPDLVLTGRTVFGHSPAKGQQLEDHYFGSIPERVMSFMRDFENESLKLGIPVRTRHNEVAPNQFECAPVFEEVNIAVDHNQLLMDLMEKIARKHNFRVLFHEKPFAGVNGSGKHNNWSMGTNTGKNLLSPGKTPKTNLQFLTFFVNTIKAVYENDDLLRASIASAGNDHRLGANEAPPAIISVFLGSQLSAILDELVSKVKKGKLSPEEKTDLKLNIGKIPEILLDNTDRNRTSPFAFTGNKFEFRAVGSSANCAQAMIAINSAMTSQLIEFKKDVDTLISKGEKKDDAILKVLKQYIEVSTRIRFEGNGYSDEWVAEAAKRGLNNIKTTPQALDALVSKKTVKLWTSLGVFNEREIHARHDIYLESYTKKIQIEGRVIGDLALNHIIPTAIEYQNKLIENVKGLKELYGAGFKKLAEVQLATIEDISSRIAKISNDVEAMTEERKKANAMSDVRKQSIAYCDKVVPYFEKIRYEVDKLELLVSDEAWPLPKYREMLFHR